MPSRLLGRPTADAVTDRSRRRFARRQWARRWLAWKWLVSLVVLVALVATTVWLVFFSSYLAIRDTGVHGNRLLSEAQVLEVAAVPTGEPLATADLDAIRARVAALAPVKSVDVVRRWPDRVEITIVERQVVAVVDVAGTIRGMDEEGVLFRDYDRAPPDLPRVLVETATSTDALAEAATVIGSMPADLAARVDHVEVRSVDQISLVLHSGATVEWGSADQSADKARVLAALIDAEPGSVYDVSVPGNPAVRPGPASPTP